ncbi:kelch domain-containing protein [Plasmodium vivax]|uniref:Kelch domain-containing protein n=1 Tax=Plasmodium vivax (strain Salvador I) TaxID=126793 RepID=A5K4R8_PLAVS|nr:kelch domain-containing protein [Plasmodium vivax]EDL45646.1 kelch domain-containing protein [Plasmodium vivax]|eukprot:XP_001615373.1 kelch domain-containing protein [Plasmodium vivax Sal-1]
MTSSNKFLNIKKEDSYLAKFTHDTIIFAENLFKIIAKPFTHGGSSALEEYADDGNVEAISFCSEVLPFYCKSELIHRGDIFNVRFGHSCIFYKNSIYIYGGNQLSESFNSKLIKFSTETQIFSLVEGQTPPQSRYYATLNLVYSSALSEHCLFLFGGKRGKYITNDTYLFNLSNNSWKHMKVQFSPPPVFGHVSFKYKNIIFIHGGNMGNLNVNNDIWCYFEEEKKWVKIMSKDEYYKKEVYKPSARFFHSCSVCISNQGNDVRAFIFGGLNANNKCAEDTFWCYSLGNGKWTPIENSLGKVPVERFGHSSTVLNDRWFLLCGGYNFCWYSKSELLDIHAYDINLNTWSSLNVYGTPLVTHHFYGKIIQVDESGYFFIFGGLRNNETSSKIYKFTPLLASPYFKLLRDKIDEMERKVLYLEKNPLQLLNPSYGRDINEIKGTLSGISFTLVRYIQLASDINEKIKISNELAQSNYPQLAEKFEQYNKQYDSLVNRIDLLDSTLSVSDLDVRGGNENNLRKSSSSFTLSSEVSGEGSGQQSEQQSGQQGGQQRRSAERSADQRVVMPSAGGGGHTFTMRNAPSTGLPSLTLPSQQ